MLNLPFFFFNPCLRWEVTLEFSTQSTEKEGVVCSEIKQDKEKAMNKQSAVYVLYVTQKKPPV